MLRNVAERMPPPQEKDRERSRRPRLPGGFSKLEIIFCVFLTENDFVNALIPFIGVKGRNENNLPYREVPLS